MVRDRKGRTVYELVLEQKKAMKAMKDAHLRSIISTEKFYKVQENLDLIINFFEKRSSKEKHIKEENSLKGLKNKITNFFQKE